MRGMPRSDKLHIVLGFATFPMPRFTRTIQLPTGVGMLISRSRRHPIVCKPHCRAPDSRRVLLALYDPTTPRGNSSVPRFG